MTRAQSTGDDTTPPIDARTTTTGPTALDVPLNGHRDFRLIWSALSVSLVGSQVTVLALPLFAIMALDASAAQLGVLGAAATLPFLLFSLPTGTWVDRRRRRPLLIVSDIARSVLLASIPIAYWLDVVRFEHLVAIAFLAGAFEVVFEVGHYALVPGVVGRARVVEANSRLQVSYSAAEAGGPGLAGLLIQAASAPFAILIDAASFAVSALLLGRIATPEPTPCHDASRGVRSDIADGLRAVLGHPLLRPIVLGAICWTVCAEGINVLFILYASRELGLDPLVIGLIFAARGVAAVLGALISTPLTVRFGVGATIVGGWVLQGAGWLAAPLTTGSLAVPVIMAGLLVGGAAGTVLNIQQWSLRQIVTPNELQGRVTASHRFLVYGAGPFGALLGGWLGTVIGLRPSLVVLAAGAMASALWVAFSPVRRLQQQPLSQSADQQLLSFIAPP